VNPAAQVCSFNRWIDEYVDLCRHHDSHEADYEVSLEKALREMVLQEFSASAQSTLSKVLRTDLILNAQGLAHWQRTTQDG
jgi:hypothetical protein